MTDEAHGAVRALELFAGIGGFAEATRGKVEVAAALDISSHVLEVHALNHDGPIEQVNLEVLDAARVERYEADVWWMSPPCQPYTVRGKQRDLEDRRARSFLNMLDLIEALRPPHLAMENVEGFIRSQARERLLEVLDAAGYEVFERALCPTDLGVPARRERYYMVASREGLVDPGEPLCVERRLQRYLDEEVDEALFISPELVERHGPGMRILDIDDEDAVANCFTSAYGKTFRFSGSFLRHADGRVRYLSPREILRTLHFREDFALPGAFSRRQRYKYIGNSLSVIAVREVLRRFAWFDAGQTPT